MLNIITRLRNGKKMFSGLVATTSIVVAVTTLLMTSTVTVLADGTSTLVRDGLMPAVIMNTWATTIR